MKRIFAWIIMSLMSITAVMPSFIPFAKQNETPSVVQIEKEEEKENITPTVIPDEPTPEPDTPTPEPTPEVEPEEEEELGPVISYSSAITSATAFDNFVAEKTAELNADYINSLIVTSENPDYRGNELPSGYTQIEYLESTGTQYIDTVLSISNDLGVDVKFKPNLYGNNQIAMGALVVGTARFQPLVLTSNITGNYKVVDESILYGSNDLQTHVLSYNVNNSDILFDGAKKGEVEYIGTSPNHVYLFSRNYASDYKSSVRFYYCKFYDNGSLVRDFIPVYNSSIVLGLYDVADHTGQAGYEDYNPFYTNQGSGFFNSAEVYTHSLQGSGTESDPYQIGSFCDLEYMRKISGYNSNKYYVFTDDIVVNDGKFVENEETGEIEYHAGQSGELVLFSNLGNMNNCYINGNGHKIIGFYGPNLFNQFNNGTITDLHFENAYCSNQTNNASTHALIANNITNTTIEDCSTDGWSYGRFGTNTFVYTATDSTFNNCINYAHNIGSPWQYCAGGIVGNANNCVVENCKNYGDIKCYGNSNWVGGIVGNARNNSVIKNCFNYGDMIVPQNSEIFSGGILYTSDSASVIVENCENHGNCTSGIGYDGYELIRCCVNYGSCKSGINGGNKTADNVIIENCENYGECEKGIGAASIISGCKNYKLATSGGRGIGYAKTIQSCVNYACVENATSFYGIGSGTIKDCVNYGNASAPSSGTYNGIGAGTIINCQNHGNVSGFKDIFGIGTNCEEISYCKNYGTFTSSGGRISGIGIAKHITHCENYGNLTGSTVGGIIGWYWTDKKAVTISECTNYGTLVGGMVGGFIGECMGYNVTQFQIVNSKNSGIVKGHATYAGGFIGQIYSTPSLKIENCVNEGYAQRAGFVANAASGNNMSGHIINCANYGETPAAIAGSLVTSATFLIQNCFNAGKCSLGLYASKSSSVTINNCINCETKQYYGSDFSAFFLTWKDARIGLISLESTGLYRGKLTEKYLYEHGFEPQDHVYTGGLPDLNDEFYKLKYLESTGTQWIDTGISGGTSGGYKIRFCPVTLVSRYQQYLAGDSNTQNKICKIYANGINTINIEQGATIQSVSISQNSYLEIELKENGKCYANDTLLRTFTTGGFGTSSIYLFASHGEGLPAAMKLESLVMTKDGAIVRDFVPVMRKNDNVLGLYDKVGGKFYTNQGTGTFIGG